MTSLPRPILVGIAAAWAAAIAAQLAGAAALLHHDSLLAGGGPPLVVAALLSLLAWQVMIAAMMLPSSLPLVRLYARASAAGAAAAARHGRVPRRLRARRGAGSAWRHSARTPACTPPSARTRGWSITTGGSAASVLALAGAFQFTSLKDACLDKCRHPGQFMMRYYERGPGGGLRLGMRHGAFCVGCCWALMLVMFAAGVASLIWMALLTAVMIHEKTRPAGAHAVPVTGVALLAAASVVLAYSAARQQRPDPSASHGNIRSMAYPAYVREKARKLRVEKHLSIDEIAERLALPKTTIYYWVKDLPLGRPRRANPGQRKGNRAMQREVPAPSTRRRTRKAGSTSSASLAILRSETSSACTWRRATSVPATPSGCATRIRP